MWTVSNGSKQIHLQCLACGETTKGPIKHSEFTAEQLATMPAFDLALRDKSRSGITLEDKIGRELFLARRARERIEMTERYREYLLSPEWAEKRRLILIRDGYLCQGCLQRDATEVHHLTYDHVYNEFMFELTSVCSICHPRIHGIVRR